MFLNYYSLNILDVVISFELEEGVDLYCGEESGLRKMF